MVRLEFDPKWNQSLKAERYSENEIKQFEALYLDPRNKGKVYRSKKEAMNHLKKLRY